LQVKSIQTKKLRWFIILWRGCDHRRSTQGRLHSPDIVFLLRILYVIYIFFNFGLKLAEPGLIIMYVSLYTCKYCAWMNAACFYEDRQHNVKNIL
jgi:hypothetical protein